jgi:hypothetical protein
VDAATDVGIAALDKVAAGSTVAVDTTADAEDADPQPGRAGQCPRPCLLILGAAEGLGDTA